MNGCITVIQNVVSKKLPREKGLIYPEDITIININAPSNRAQIYEGKLTTEERNSSSITVGHFNTLYTFNNVYNNQVEDQ